VNPDESGTRSVNIISTRADESDQLSWATAKGEGGGELEARIFDAVQEAKGSARNLEAENMSPMSAEATV
jgi:hypothetical protein